MSKKPGPPNTAGSGPVRLRQIALVARDLEKAKHLLTHILGTEVIYVDPSVGQWGLDNFLVAVGGDVIEVVSPKPGQQDKDTAAGRLLARKGDGGYMLIMQTEDAKKRRQYVEEKKLARVIFGYESAYAGGEFVNVQYHPKGIRGRL
jgi:catechol 2,3-dioxygenase-like lactoylglutathione lyase family enzyme